MGFEGMTSGDRAKMLRVSEDVDTRITNGMHPTAAIKEAAVKFSLGPEQIKLAARVYNVGRFEVQRQNGATVLEKGAHFDLADGDAAIDELFPTKITTKIASTTGIDWYRDLQNERQQVLAREKHASFMEKAAKTAVPAPEVPENRYVTVHREYESLVKVASAARGGVVDAENAFSRSMDGLYKHFSLSDRAPFPEATAAVAASYGNIGAVIMDKLASWNPALRKETLGRVPTPLPANSPLMKLVKAAIDALDAFAVKQAAHQDAAWDVANFVYREALPLYGHEPDLIDCDVSLTKEAAGAMGNFGSLASTVNDIASNHNQKAQDSFELDLTDPAHEQALANLASQTTLAEIYASDPSLQKQPFEDVAEAYSNLSQLSPAAMQNPIAATARLRKHLEGGSDMFDIDQQAKVERSLADGRPKVAPLQAVGAR